MTTATRQKIDQVLASARKDLEAQLEVVRAEMARLAAEEQELTATLESLKADGRPSSTTSAGNGQRRASTRTGGARKRAAAKADGRRVRGRRMANKSTAERVEELRTVLAEGPKSRADLAAALKISPARVQQLLGELGRAVGSQPATHGRGKLWRIKDGGDGATTARSQPKRAPRQAGRSASAKPHAPKPAAAK